MLCPSCGETGQDEHGRACRTCNGLGAVDAPEPEIDEDLAEEFAQILDVLGTFETHGPGAVLDLIGARRDGFCPIGLSLIRRVLGRIAAREQADRVEDAKRAREEARKAQR